MTLPTQLRFAWLITAIVLVALQAMLFAAGLWLPLAAPDYRATYITHTTDCWRPSGTPPFLPPGALIVPMDLSYRDACALLPKGWNPRDGSNVWSNGSLAQIDVPLRPGDEQITLRLFGYSQHVSQHIEIMQPGDAPILLNIPPGSIAVARLIAPPHAAMLRVTIRIAHVHQPLDRDVMDWRQIGVALLDIRRAPAAPHG